ncbi:helix-turn-helix domain-containing protein [Streptomyces niveus]|uniref:helix-turn-helix domain-containing protein n=1 Tax=Streptomyces niveus TaxID=193462 RepID=UPI0039A5A625
METESVRRGGRGRPLADERQKFLELVGQGVSIREASRIVGINRRTGQEWMNGRNPRIKTAMRPGKRTRPEIHPITGEKTGFYPSLPGRRHDGERDRAPHFLSLSVRGGAHPYR